VRCRSSRNGDERLRSVPLDAFAAVADGALARSGDRSA
jgi:hypothetical protein